MGRILIFLTATAICISGCDPAMILTLKTSGKPNSSVTMYGDGSLVPKKNSTTGQKIVYNFPTYGSRKRDTSFYYGIGGWSDESISGITDKIDSIIINNSSDKIILNTKPAIKSYLMDHRNGYGKSRIIIEAK